MSELDYIDNSFMTTPDSFMFTPDLSEIKDELEVDTIISNIIKETEANKKKAKEIDDTLEVLGLKFDDLPEDFKASLREAFSESDVFNYSDAGSKRMVRLNEAHVLDSMRQADQLAELQWIREELGPADELEDMERILHQEMKNRKNYAKTLANQTNKKEVEKLVFKPKLENAEEELRSLEELSKTKEKPRYTSEEIEEMQKEVKHLEDETLMTKAQLQKYHNLPLGEEALALELQKLNDEIEEIEKEIHKKSTVRSLEN